MRCERGARQVSDISEHRSEGVDAVPRTWTARLQSGPARRNRRNRRNRLVRFFNVRLEWDLVLSILRQADRLFYRQEPSRHQALAYGDVEEVTAGLPTTRDPARATVRNPQSDAAKTSTTRNPAQPDCPRPAIRRTQSSTTRDPMRVLHEKRGRGRFGCTRIGVVDEGLRVCPVHGNPACRANVHNRQSYANHAPNRRLRTVRLRRIAGRGQSGCAGSRVADGSGMFSLIRNRRSSRLARSPRRSPSRRRAGRRARRAAPRRGSSTARP